MGEEPCQHCGALRTRTDERLRSTPTTCAPWPSASVRRPNRSRAKSAQLRRVLPEAARSPLAPVWRANVRRRWRFWRRSSEACLPLFWYVMAGLSFAAAPINYVLWKRSLSNSTSLRQQGRFRRAWQLFPLLGLVFLARVFIP